MRLQFGIIIFILLTLKWDLGKYQLILTEKELRFDLDNILRDIDIIDEYKKYYPIKNVEQTIQVIDILSGKVDYNKCRGGTKIF